MDRTTLTAAGIAALLGGWLLFAGWSNNRSLAQQIEVESDALRQLERELRSPDAENNALSALRPSPELFTPLTLGNTSEQRIQTALERIDKLVASVDHQTQGQIFSVMPDLLRLFSSLEVDEMIAVAERPEGAPVLDPGGGHGTVKLALLLLAAEQDPARVLDLSMVRDETGTLRMFLESIATTNREAALEWLKNADLTPWQMQYCKKAFATPAPD